MSASPTATRHWNLNDIPFHAIERDRIDADTDLFHLLVAASFVEITSDLYTENLVEYFSGDDEVQDWLAGHWQAEELQHGAALRRYVNEAWPQFDWEPVYRRFHSDYKRLCAVEQLGPTRALELAARCVVETGTATLYTTLGRLSSEPVLKELTERIRLDEVRHYHFFYHQFLRYRERERTSRTAVARTLWARVHEIDDEDAYISFKHAAGGQTEQSAGDRYRAFRRRVVARARRHYPIDMAVKMIVKPLGLSGRMQRVAVAMLGAGARWVVFR